MSKETIDILNECHKKHIVGIESIHTKEFPAVYTDTALDAMDIFAEQQSLQFFEWLNNNYYKGANGWIPHAYGSFASGNTLKEMYKKFLVRDWFSANEKRPKYDKEVICKFKDEAPFDGYYREQRKCMLSDVAKGAGECGEGFTDKLNNLPVDVTHWKYAKTEIKK
jgi:hypothetical protein